MYAPHSTAQAAATQISASYNIHKTEPRPLLANEKRVPDRQNSLTYNVRDVGWMEGPWHRRSKKRSISGLRLAPLGAAVYFRSDCLSKFFHEAWGYLAFSGAFSFKLEARSSTKRTSSIL